jgi:hypothetical protein
VAREAANSCPREKASEKRGTWNRANQGEAQRRPPPVSRHGQIGKTSRSRRIRPTYRRKKRLPNVRLADLLQYTKAAHRPTREGPNEGLGGTLVEGRSSTTIPLGTGETGPPRTGPLVRRSGWKEDQTAASGSFNLGETEQLLRDPTVRPRYGRN